MIVDIHTHYRFPISVDNPQSYLDTEPFAANLASAPKHRTVTIDEMIAAADKADTSGSLPRPPVGLWLCPTRFDVGFLPICFPDSRKKPEFETFLEHVTQSSLDPAQLEDVLAANAAWLFQPKDEGSNGPPL